MAKVGIVMGSKSDMHIAEKAAAVLDECGIEYDIEVISAHRNPIKIKKWSSALEENGYGAVIAIAGLAAHLPGVVASLTVLPVIGVPGDVGPLQGKDALYSIVQMPPGIPVACIGIANGKNAGLFAVQALAAGQPELFQKLKEFRKQFGDDES